MVDYHLVECPALVDHYNQASAIREFGFLKVLPIINSCRLNAVFLTNHSPRIICTSKIGNLSEQVGVPPGVGSVYGHFEVLGGGV